ncbi:MAG: phosphate signaling complex protein PhoU [bacterium]
MQDFTVEMEELKNEMIEMGNMVQETIIDSVEALESQNMELAEEIINHDDDLDDLEMELKDKCQKLISYPDLSDKDVRTLLTISETVTNLERIGDHAENIAEMVEKIGIQPLIKPLVDIPRMRNITTDVLEKSLNAFLQEDVATAKNLAQQDEIVDNLNVQIFRELITFMMEDQSSIKQASALILVSRYLERIGDHCTNICEGIIYMVSGKRESY